MAAFVISPGAARLGARTPTAASVRRSSGDHTVAVARRRPAATRMTVAAGATQLEQLSQWTSVVADTGDVATIKRLSGQLTDATTNPSLVAAAAEMEEYAGYVEDAVAFGKKHGGSSSEVLELVRDKLFVTFGSEILQHLKPEGVVSTEVDARLSFDVEGSIAKGEQLIQMYKDIGVPRERVLIKLASTWEGVEACRELQKRGINCNMTLLFCAAQGAAAADAGAFLVSPFVGRILDWHKKARGVDSIPAAEDPGVRSVKDIYHSYKCHGAKTVVMGASFRNKEEILELAGCDRLTISPKLLDALASSTDPIERRLSQLSADQCGIEEWKPTEKEFRWALNEDACATEKLAEGIRGFTKDLIKLDKKLSDMLL
ncbi:hypothetical protein MMPV_000681 [Pyropia vietnamensis]